MSEEPTLSPTIADTMITFLRIQFLILVKSSLFELVFAAKII